jgi:hypothetical protein
MASLSWKELLLQEAARRFEEQQQANKAAELSSTTLMAPISPSPQILIDEALNRLATETDVKTSQPIVGW